MNYQIIYLNGPSSSGKTTLGKALQEKLATPFLLLSADMLLEAMPDKVNHWQGNEPALGYYFKKVTTKEGVVTQQVMRGPYAKKMTPAFQAMILALCQQGMDMIIDDISFGKVQIDEWRKLLTDHKVLWVGLKPSVEVLEMREKLRGNRIVGSARDQLARVHRGVHYDLELDSGQLSLDAMVGEITRLC